MTSIHKVLLEIFDSQSFDRLEPYKQAEVWEGLAQKERILLARLLVMQGAAQFAEGSQQALESFENANKVSSNAPEILFQQGIVLASNHQNIRCLNLALEVLERALQQAPSFSEALYLRAKVLVDIGFFENDASYFIQADQCFEQVSNFWSQDQQEGEVKNDYFWKWGLCLASLGSLSGEPIDYHRANEKFRKALECGCRNLKFLIDFGRCLLDLGSLVEIPQYFLEASRLFNQVIDQSPKLFDGWYYRACSLKSLIDFKGYSHLYEQADLSFLKAVEINPDCSSLWLKWGQLEITAGKLKHDAHTLELSLLKFERANQLDPSNPQILTSWAESELCLGAQEERLDLIQSAKRKILNSLEMLPEDPSAWYIYGSCLNELGGYFNDEECYHQAIEKFRYGLSLTRHHPLLWYGLALAYFALGELTEDQRLVEKSVRYCARVVESGGEGFPQFWNDWGVVLLKLGEMTEQASYVEMSIEKFEKALKLPLENVEGEDLDLEWVYNYSCAYDLLGDLKEEPHHFEKAIQIFTQILQLDPDYMMARYSLAIAFSHLGDAMDDVDFYQKSVEQFQLLVDQDPENDMIHLEYGMALTSLGLLTHDLHHPERSECLYRQAESSLMQAVSLGNTQAYYQLAGLYSITNHYQQAIYYLERAQSCDTLPGIEDLMHDEWLEGLRGTPAFRQFIQGLSTRQSTDDK
ncbi:MAG: hypothetical protein ACH350_00695 [Parachlamydiaceae bacterium]